MKVIYKKYRFLYFILLFWLYKMHGKDESPAATAEIGLSFYVLLNIFSIPILIQGITGVEVLGVFQELPIIATIFIALAFKIFNNFLLVRRGRYLKIIEEFHSENENVNRKRILIAWCYIIGTPLYIYIAGILVYLRFPNN